MPRPRLVIVIANDHIAGEDDQVGKAGRTMKERIMRMLRTAGVPILLSSGAALAQDKVTDHAVSGPAAKEIRAGWFGNLKADCSSGRPPQARVVDHAQNGMIMLRNGRVRTNSAPNCPNAELPAVVVFYQSKPGFIGTDSFTLEVKAESGASSRHKFNVTVAGMIQ